MEDKITITDNYFTKPEAEAKVGLKIQTLVSLSGAPIGTTGTITGTRNYDDEDFGVEVTYDLPASPGTKPNKQYFGKYEFERFLKVIS